MNEGVSILGKVASTGIGFSILVILLLITASGIFYYHLNNPEPVKLKVEEIKEISVRPFLNPEASVPLILTETGQFEPIVRVINGGSRFEKRDWATTANLEMTITLKDGMRIVFGDAGNLKGDGTFMIWVDSGGASGKIYSMLSPELKDIFADFEMVLNTNRPGIMRKANHMQKPIINLDDKDIKKIQAKIAATIQLAKR